MIFRDTSKIFFNREFLQSWHVSCAVSAAKSEGKVPEACHSLDEPCKKK
jgi:hypothetical protein